MVSTQITELRYSLNGISESQLLVLFDNLEKLNNQIIMKRLAAGPSSITLDDIILEGGFTDQFIHILARTFPPPLSFRIETSVDMSEYLRDYASFEWRNNPILFCGVTLFPFHNIKQQLNFENPWQFLRLISTTEASTVLKPLLAVKPKGLIAVHRTMIEFVLPMHRIDFLVKWTDQMQNQLVDVNWISGSTGELNEDLTKSVGSIDQSRTPALNSWIERTSISEDLDFEKLFKRALLVLDL